MMLIEFVFTLFLPLVFLYILFAPRKFPHLPSPKAVPILRHSYNLFFSSEKPTQAFYEYTLNTCRKLKTNWLLDLGSNQYIVVQNEEIHKILKNADLFAKDASYEFLIPPIGDGLLVSKDHLWKQRRKMMNAYYTISQLKPYQECFNKQAARVVQTFYEKYRQKPFDAYRLCSTFVLNTICEVTLGVIPDLDGAQKEWYAALMVTDKQPAERLLNPFYKSDWIYFKTAHGKEFLRNSGILRRWIIDIVQSRVDLMRTSSDSLKGDTIVDNLVWNNLGDGTITEKGIVNEATMTVLAGHDTTSFTLTLTLLLLACYPEVQQKAREEVESIVDSNGDIFLRYEDLNRLIYLDCVTKEAMRLYPAVPMVPRLTTDSVELGGHKYPKGTRLILAFHAYHTNQMYYEKPLEFIPERFLDENRNPKNVKHSLPFSAGPRNCIGTRFANNEIKVLLSHILTRYKILTVSRMEDVRLEVAVTTKLVKPISVKLEPL